MLTGIRKIATAFLLLSLASCGGGGGAEISAGQAASDSQTTALTAPVARDDSTTSLGNMTLTRAAGEGVLANDTVNGSSLSTGSTSSEEGGRAEIQADGSYSYFPPAGFTGTDRFSYTLSNAAGASSATVTVTVSGLAYFVDNRSSTGGDGTEANPFSDISKALAVATSGQSIVLSVGDGTSRNQRGPLTLPQGVSLVGRLSLEEQVLGQGDPMPVVAGPVFLSNDSQIVGIHFEASAAQAVVGQAISNVRLEDNTFSNSADQHIELSNVGGDVYVQGNEFSNHTSTQPYISIDNDNTNSRLFVQANVIRDDQTNDPDDGVVVTTRGSSVAELFLEDNLFQSTNALGAFRYAVEVSLRDSTTTSMSVRRNQFSQYGEGALFVSGLGLNFEATSFDISQNEISGGTFVGMQVTVPPLGPGVTISENSLSEPGDFGIIVNSAPSFSGQAVIFGNTITSATQTGLSLNLESVDSGPSNEHFSFLVRGNSILSSSGLALQAFVFYGGELCLELVQNIFDRSVFLATLGGPENGELVGVERLSSDDGGPLQTVNTFRDGADVQTQGAVESRPASFCSSP